MTGEEGRGGGRVGVGRRGGTWVGVGEESMKRVHVDSLIKCNKRCRFILSFFMSMEIIYFFFFFHLASLVAQTVKNLLATQET